MPRVKRGTTAHARHKKVIKLAKGYRGKRKNVFKLAKNAVMKAGQNAYRDRRLRKRTFHQLWILRINAACRAEGLKYSRFIYGLELANIRINRKMLSELATNHPEAFKALVIEAKAALPEPGKAPDLNDLAKKFGKATAVKAKKVEKEAKEEVTEAVDASEEKVEKKTKKKKEEAKKEEKVEEAEE